MGPSSCTMLGDVGELRRRPLRGDAVGFHLSGADRLQHRLRGGEEQVDMVAGDVLQRRRRAAIGDVVDRHLGLLGEQRGGQVSGAAGAGMRHFRRRGLHPGDELAERVRRQRLAPDQHQRVVVDEGDRREVLLGVEGKVRVQRDVGGNLQIVQQQRVPSGAARATRPVAIVVAPPLTFSTMKFCPSFSENFGASTRASWSVGPPAG